MPPRLLLVAALLSLALGVGLYEGFAGGHYSATAGAHLRASSHLGPASATQKKSLSSLPVAAQGPISQALGAGNPAYRVSASRAGFAAVSPAQRLALRFSRSGVSISSGASHVGLSLQAAGYGSTLSALGAVAPHATSNRVVYQRPGLSESYVNGPLGLEQGFTIAKAPSAHSAGPLTLSLALSGNGRNSLGSDGKSVTLGRVRGSALRYSGLSASDAGGRALHSWLELHGGRLLLRVDARGARYPLRIDPFVQQEKLIGGGERGEEGHFGYSVALSPEGNTALIGGPSDNGGVGAAWVFTRASEKWTQQGAKLTGKEEAGAGEFGKSVALSSEGTTTYALIGGSADNEHQGAVWAFARSGTTWTQQGPKLIAKSGEEVGPGEFGLSVALSAEVESKTYAVIGAPGDKEKNGAAWVFLRTGTAWAQQGAKLVAKSGEESVAGEFGFSVALASAKGEYALIGAPADSARAGSGWVFLRTGTAWAQQGAKLIAKSPEEIGAGEFGLSVALSSEGKDALIGAPGDNAEVGAAWVFTRVTTTWAQQGTKLTGTGESGAASFGASVALASNGGNTALIAGPDDNAVVGATWVFTRSGVTWTQQGTKLTAKAGEEIGAGEFGAAVALASEGNTALMSAQLDRGGVGAAWAFTRAGVTWTQQGAKLTGTGEVHEGEQGGKGAFGYSVALSPEGNTALIGGYLDGNHAGAAWVFTRSGATWTQQGAKLTGGGEESGAGEFGKSVALSAEVEGKTYAVIGAPVDNAKVGAAWVFTRASEKWTQQGAKLIAKSGEETGPGEFGASVSLAATKGEYALIGAPGDKEKIGAAWVFNRVSTTWTQQGAKLVAKSPEETGSGEFGKSVAVSAEGTYALMGAPADKEGLGAAWVFNRVSTTWTQQGAKLVAKSPEEVGSGSFGYSVALSGEVESKTYALIGAPADNAKVGAAWAFLRTGTEWKQTGTKLVAKTPEETGAGEFGASVALAATKAEYALIGAPADNTKVGAAWAFLRTGTELKQQGTKLIGTGETGAGEVGLAVALSGTGEYALTGGWKDNQEIGAAWVFLRTGTEWKQQGEKLVGAGEVSGAPCLCGKGNFGYSVALSADGNTALIGGPATLGLGAAWVFTRSGTTWTQQGPALSAKGGEVASGGEFGKSVALSGEGNTALIGGPSDNGGVGAAWVFTRSGPTWTQQGAKLTGGGESGMAEFGKGVALSSDGNTALIGGTKDGVFPVGAAWVFTRASEKWAQQGEKLVVGGLSLDALFGSTVALSSDGNTALIGAPGNKEKAGGAWVYTRSSEKWVQQSGELTGGGESGFGEFGQSAALSSDGSTALIGGPGDNESTGAAWAFTRSGTIWAQQGAKLTGSGESGFGELGQSVALSSDGNTGLIGGPGDSEGVGAAWTFTRSGTIWTGQVPKLTGSAEIGAGSFGYSVALSAEGNTALMGGYFDNSNVGATWVFVQNAPTVVTKAASSVTQTTATLNATVNPNGSAVSDCKFEYGTTESYGSTASCASLPGSGNNPVAVSAAVTGLTANATYHFRISASNAVPTTSKGSDETLKTPPAAPTVVTAAASALTQTTATLNATVNPNGTEVTECKFEYGATETYGSTASCAALPGSGTSPVAVSAAITGLTANTTYHFRISATNVSGTSKGTDLTLKTPPNAPTVVTTAATAVTQTTATLNATVNPEGGNVTECKFEYGTTESYGSTASCASLPGSGTSAVAVSAAITSLASNTTYHFRISATNVSGTSKGTDLTLKTPPNAPTVVTTAATAVTQTTATLNATVNPEGGNVTECKFEYDTTIAYGTSASCASLPGSGTSPVAVSVAITGLTANTTYHFRISATNVSGTSKGTDLTLKTPPNAPTVVTTAATAVAQTTATLNATVNPEGGNVTECKFEYGTTIAYGTSASCASLPGSGTSAVAVSAAITSLAPNTNYHFRISATNAGGTNKGADETLKTSPKAPNVVTTAASTVAQTTATLNATVNPEGGNVTECKFEYGTTIAYGTSASCASLPGSGTSAVAVSAAIASLAPNTSYHFRISATNASGTSKGTDETFKTPTNAPTVITKPATSVTQTSATLNATVNPNGGEVSECKFEVGETAIYTFTVACSSLPGSGTSAVAVTGVLGLASLSPNTTYHFRISATNAAGTGKGADETFKTLPNAPTVVTKAASAIAQTTATLNATVNPEGGNVTECKFEYGTTNAYGASASCASLPGSETSAVAVSASVTGLSANTTYHFRISATNAGGTSKGGDETFKTQGSLPTVVTVKASAITQTSATLNATVNPNGGTVSDCKFEVGETTTYAFAVPCSSLPGSGTSPVAVTGVLEALSLAENTTYHYRISATNAGGTSRGADEAFKTLPNPPAVVSEPATSLTQTTATLNATVNPNGGEVSECKFEYGTTNGYGSSAPCAAGPGSGESPVAVSAPLTGLAANTTYHFRISATNAGGTSKGADETFTTQPNAPSVLTKPATSLTQTTATLNATVNPNGGEVSECKFEYGTTNGYGSSAPCAAGPGSGESPVAVSAPLTGLAANTTYHFRISATNAAGTSKGADEAFTTQPSAPGVETKAASALSASSATLNATVNPNGGEVSDCKFEYGATNAYGFSASCSSLPGSGTSPVAVSAALSGLTPNSTYHFRISATNLGGTSKGADEVLKTLGNPPTVVTGAPSSVRALTATLNATVNPNGVAIGECALEYGTTTAYGSSSPCTPSPGAGNSPVAVSAQISGLTAASTYHFRISAGSAAGSASGSDQAFKTLPTTGPHYYRSGGAISAGEKVPYVAWGTLTLTPEPAIASPTTCETGSGGVVENLEGSTGLPGTGQASQFAAWNCSNAACPPGKVKVGEAEYEREYTLTSGRLPWSSVLSEEEAGKIRSESSGVQMVLACVARGSKKASEGPGTNEPVELGPPTVCVSTPTAALSPLLENGKSSTITSKLTFDKNDGALNCTGGGEFTGKLSGKLKLMAYKESEVISARNP